jgi:prepilin-type N-terminal cleavage/methylation domain-containing protein
MKAKRAFTRIELLVVISLIAILAAILFPVCAQAKEAAKKASTLSNFKQIGTAFQIYLADTDDRYPKSFGMDTNVMAERFSFYHRVPQNWDNTAPFNTPQRQDEDGTFWANSLQPYIKNLEMYAQVGVPTTVNVSFVNAVKGRAKMGVTFNGMLHTWSGTSIAQPSKCPVVWAGLMKQNRDGVARSSPTLDCNRGNASPCIFTPGQCPQTGGTADALGQGLPVCAPTYANYGYFWWGFATPLPYFTTWIYGHGMIFTSSDTSSRHKTLVAPLVPAASMNTNDNPFSQFDPGGAPGAPYWMTDCMTPGKAQGSEPVFYPGFFRPDSNFSWTHALVSL